jgi:hypothetical protein
VLGLVVALVEDSQPRFGPWIAHTVPAMSSVYSDRISIKLSSCNLLYNVNTIKSEELRD